MVIYLLLLVIPGSIITFTSKPSVPVMAIFLYFVPPNNSPDLYMTQGVIRIISLSQWRPNLGGTGPKYYSYIDIYINKNYYIFNKFHLFNLNLQPKYSVLYSSTLQK